MLCTTIARRGQRVLRSTRSLPTTTTTTTTARLSQKPSNKVDVETLLSKPTWSIASLLPSPTTSTSSATTPVSSAQLHHLLRLSALPPPASAAEEEKMLKTLSDQLHFVNEIRRVDTTGVEPLRSLRDETSAGRKEQEIGLERLRDAFGTEEVRGKYYRRIRRKQEEEEDMKGAVPGKSEEEDWDVLGAAEKKVGRYFVVEGGKEG